MTRPDVVRGPAGNGQSRLPGWSDARLHLPAYSWAEAGRLARVSPRTIGRWYRGEVRSSSGADGALRRMRPVLPAPGRGMLAWLELVEVAFVAELRHNGIALERLRQAHAYLRGTFGVDHPFAQLRFKTDGVHVLTEVAGASADAALVVADADGQLAWTDALVRRFDQFDYQDGLAVRWYPRGRDGAVFVVDPRVAFGAPRLAGTGVPARAVRARHRAGESDQEIARDFGLDPAQVDQILQFEEVRAAAA